MGSAAGRAMALDKWIAVIVMAIALVYGYASVTYPLLPFERNMAFLPNTMPMVLSVLAIMLSLIIVLAPKPKGAAEEPGDFDLSKIREYKIGQASALIGAMLIFAVALRPIGFIAATTLFLFGTGWILGERKILVMGFSSAAGAFIVWYLVQELLGIFLRPLPWFLS